ncbi:MAG: hypothetical protein VX699_12425 [Myxococcota bacterium]|nr:hypothetical protein [Myxococcota bacterium]
MKALHTFYSLLIALSLTLAACGPEISPDTTGITLNAPGASELSEGLAECGRTWIPEGTTTRRTRDGGLYFRVPAGYSVVHHEGPAANQLAAGGKVTCTCTAGSGDCSPASDGSSVGCLIGSNCSTCKRESSFTVINRDVGVRFATAEEVANLPQGTSALLEVPELAREFEQFTNSLDQADRNRQAASPIQRSNNQVVARPGYTFAPVNAFGRIIYTRVHHSQTQEQQRLAGAGALSAKGTCNCESGSSGCTYWSSWGYFGCEAGDCTSCSLTTSSVRGPGPKALQVKRIH